METRNAKLNAAGGIDCEINHPKFGWIPFTASPDDSETQGRAIYADLQAKGGVAAYVAPPPPTPPTEAEILANESDERAAIRLLAEMLDPTQKARVNAVLAGDKSQRKVSV